MIALAKDATRICQYMGMTPLLGMALPAVFTLANVLSVHFCNVRWSQGGSHVSKLQDDEGIKPE